MRLIYEDTDITSYADITACVYNDTAGDKCDTLDITLQNAAAWHRWKPQKNDRIAVVKNGYNSGTLYLHTVLPENGAYRIIATGISQNATTKRNAIYHNKTLAHILNECAAECGMISTHWGIETNYGYNICRDNESAPAFLNRILRMEGARLKAHNGKLICIGIGWAQDLQAAQKIKLTPDQDGVRYLRMDNVKKSSHHILTPYADASAFDTAANYAPGRTFTHYPAMNNVQAGRWARGTLLCENIEAEEITLSIAYNPGMTAMCRIDVESATEMQGDWLVHEAEHDLINNKTTVRMQRCIRTII